MRATKYSIKLCKESSALYDFEAKTVTNSPLTVANLMRDVFRMDEQAEEIFVMVALDTKNKPIGFFEVSRGTLNASIVHPREVFKRAILANAFTIVLGHNHPSGNPSPSAEDKLLTKRLCEAGKLMGINVLDHVILGDYYGYYSFKEDGELS